MFKKCSTLLLLAAFCIPVPVFAQAVIQATTPATNNYSAPRSINVEADYTQNMAQPGSGDLRIYSPKRGWLPASYGVNGTTIEVDPTTNFLAGEEITVVSTAGVQDSTGQPSAPYSWQFRPATKPMSPMFNTNTYQYQSSTGGTEWASVCADFDGDGDIDIAVGRYYDQSMVYFNTGGGTFNTTVNLGSATALTYDLGVGDFDEDGDIDIVQLDYGNQNVLWLNDGSGNFPSSVNVGASGIASYCLAVGDVNNDGHLDVVCGNGSTGGLANTIHLGDGSGAFPTTKYVELMAGSGTAIQDCTFDLELADMDNDGSLDIVTAEFALGTSFPPRVYYNDGDAGFFAYELVGTTLVPLFSDIGPAVQAMAVGVGDLDGDGDNDVIIGTNGNPGTTTPKVGDLTRIGINDGNGNFTVSYMSYQDEKTWCIRMADFDGDGDLDTIFVNEGGYRTVRLNNGAGQFFNYLPLGGMPVFYKCDVADMDADGTVDVVSPGWVFYNGAKAPEIRVKVGGTWLNNGDSVQVAHGETLANLAPQVLVTDAQSYNVDVTTAFGQVTTEGFVSSEWGVSQAATPCNLYPTTGVFNNGGMTLSFNLQADNGSKTGYFSFTVSVANPTVPVLKVDEAGSPINANATASGGRAFGAIDVAAGATAPTTITVSNQGWVDLQIASVALAGADAQDFVLDLNGLNYTVTPGGSTTFAVQFDPSTPGAKSAQVQIQHNDPAAPSPFTFDVTGTGTAYAAITVSEGGNTLAQGGQIAFGSVPLGTSSAQKTVTVQNTGSGILTLGAPTLAGPGAGEFSVDTALWVVSVAPGSSASFAISFNPTTPGNHAATVSFAHDDGSTVSPFTLNLSGTGPGAGGGNDGGSGDGGSGGCVGVSDGLGSHLLLLFAIFAAGLLARRVRARRA